MDQLSDFNFDQYLGDSRDDEEYQYRGLDQVKEEYFKKYTGANNFLGLFEINKLFRSFIIYSIGIFVTCKK